jgi:hypothetical protein
MITQARFLSECLWAQVALEGPRIGGMLVHMLFQFTLSRKTFLTDFTFVLYLK